MADLHALEERLNRLDHREKVIAAKSINQVVVRERANKYYNSLSLFTQAAWHIIEPTEPLIWNWHLDVICAYLQAFFSKRIPKLIINTPPGSMKSILFSAMGPAWWWLHDPGARYVNVTNAKDLALRDAERMKDIVKSDWFKMHWPNRVEIVRGRDALENFRNDKKGSRVGLGIESKITGKRGSHLLLDDLVDASEAFSQATIETANRVLDQSLTSRLNNLATDCIGMICQRLMVGDPTDHLIKKLRTKYVVVKITQEYEGTPGYDPVRDLGPEYEYLKDPRTKVGELLFPERFTRDVVLAAKEDLGFSYSAQHQQRPSPLIGGIIKASYWRIWPDDRKFPKILHTFSSWDLPFSKSDFESNSFAARTDWGVWQDEQDVPAHAKNDRKHLEHNGRFKLLLLGAWWDRVDFPSIIEEAKKVQKRRLKRPSDAHVFERAASGYAALDVLRRNQNLRIIGYDPKRDGGGDKHARGYKVQPLFQQGIVWAPNRPWAVGRDHDHQDGYLKGVIEWVADFPAAVPPCSDIFDTVTQAVNFLSNGWWIHHPDDDIEPADAVATDMAREYGLDFMEHDEEIKKQREKLRLFYSG